MPAMRHILIFISYCSVRPGQEISEGWTAHLPPHLLADPVGTATEALGGAGKVVRFILQRV